MEEDVSSYWMTLRKERILKIESESAESHSGKKSLCKRLWTRRKTDNRMNTTYTELQKSESEVAELDPRDPHRFHTCVNII